MTQGTYSKKDDNNDIHFQGAMLNKKQTEKRFVDLFSAFSELY